MIGRSMKRRKLSSLRYAFCDLDFFWRRRSEAKVTFARGLIIPLPLCGALRRPAVANDLHTFDDD
jgi:hypothetical protein